MLRMGVDKLNLVLEHCRDGVPREMCGLLSGRGREVARVYALPNLEDDPNRFFAAPENQYQAFKDIEQRGETLLAIYHSHPNGDPEPSLRDIEMAYYPGIVYLILAMGTTPRLRAYRIRNRCVRPDGLQVVAGDGSVRECGEYVFGPGGPAAGGRRAPAPGGRRGALGGRDGARGGPQRK